MGLEASFDDSGLRRKLRAVEDVIKELPADVAKNPVALAVMDYQRLLATTERPTIAETGNFFGDRWPKHGPQYVRDDGTFVPRWGNVAKKHGRGKVKGQIKSEGVGTGKGSRYKASDRQLGARAGGLWMDWVTQKPVLLDRNFKARITSPFAYARRQFRRRPVFTPELKVKIEEFLEVRGEAYLSDIKEYLERKGTT